MNQDPVIQCPKCGEQIKLTDSLAGPLVAATRAEYEVRLQRRNDEISEKERVLKEQKVALEATITERIREREQQLRDDAQRDAAESVRSVHAEADRLRQDLVAAQQAQAEALKKERDLESRERALELTVQTRINQS